MRMMPVKGAVDSMMVFPILSKVRLIGSDEKRIHLSPSLVLKMNCTPRRLMLLSVS